VHQSVERPALMFATKTQKRGVTQSGPFATRCEGLTNVSYFFRIPINLINQVRAVRFPEDWFPPGSRHFWTTSSRVHRIIHCAAHVRNVVGQDCSVVQGDLHDGLPRRFSRRSSSSLGTSCNFGAKCEGRPGPFHAGGLSCAAWKEAVLSMSITEDHVLEADIGHLAIIDDACFGVGPRRHDDRLHLVGDQEGAFFQNVVYGIERALVSANPRSIS